jgi:fatty acid desaturase
VYTCPVERKQAFVHPLDSRRRENLAYPCAFPGVLTTHFDTFSRIPAKIALETVTRRLYSFRYPLRCSPSLTPWVSGLLVGANQYPGRKGPNLIKPDKSPSVEEPGENPAPLLVKGSASRSRINQYAELKRLIKQNGLLDRQPAYYAGKITFTFGLLAVGLALLLILDNPWLQLLDAAYLAFVFVQISLLAHDCGHRQFSFRTSWKNDCITLIVGNLLLGVSRQWWIDKHNEHHGHPNQIDVDPDIDIPLLAFEEEQALDKRGLARFVVKHQAFLIFPLSLLQSLSMTRSSVRFLFEKKAKSTLAEALALGAHFVLYLGLLFSVLEPLQAVLFVAVHRGLFGMYMVSIFAPNHKAMPVLNSDSQLDFLHRQVLTSRNVIAHPITDFWYGGLNYQIEHHLFPRLPRNKLREAQPIIKDFCGVHAIAYYETSVLQSYREILQHLHEVGAPLREAGKAR